MGVGDDKRHVSGDRADIGDMIVNALQLQTDGAQHAGARRDLDLGRALHGVAKGGCVSET